MLAKLRSEVGHGSMLTCSIHQDWRYKHQLWVREGGQWEKDERTYTSTRLWASTRSSYTPSNWWSTRPQWIKAAHWLIVKWVDCLDMEMNVNANASVRKARTILTLWILWYHRSLVNRKGYRKNIPVENCVVRHIIIDIEPESHRTYCTSKVG